METFTIRNLSFSYPEQERKAIDDLSLSVFVGVIDGVVVRAARISNVKMAVRMALHVKASGCKELIQLCNRRITAAIRRYTLYS